MKSSVCYAMLFFVFSIPSIYSQQLHLPSSSNWVNLGNLNINGDQITLEAFIYMEAEPITLNKFDILSKHENISNCNYFFRHSNFGITTYNNGNSGNTTFYNLFSDFNYDLFRWYHVAATYDGQIMRYYVNGCLVNEMLANGNLFQNDFPTGLGQRWVIEDEQFIGYLDEVKIWNRALNATEIAQNLNGINDPVNAPGLLAYYTFADGFTNDANPGTFDGTAVNNPVITADNPPVFPNLSSILLQTATENCEEDSGIIIPTDDGMIEYSLDGAAFSTENNWDNLSSGSHILVARGMDWCIDTSFTISIASSTQVETFIEAHLCPGDTIYLDQQAILSAGTYQAIFPLNSDCDSIVNLVVASSSNEFFATTYDLCDGNVLEIEGPVDMTNWSTGEMAGQIQIQNSGIYTASWVDEMSCQLQDSFTVVLREGMKNTTAYAPNIFSPNSDGLNDKFGLSLAGESIPDDYLLRIFDRWGGLIFETNDPLDWWDGKQNGTFVDPGTYVWMSRYTSQSCVGTTVHNLSGSISLIR